MKCPVTFSVPIMLINGHRVHGRLQPPPSAESAVIYGIGSLREQLFELREAPKSGLALGVAWMAAAN